MFPIPAARPLRRLLPSLAFCLLVLGLPGCGRIKPKAPPEPAAPVVPEIVSDPAEPVPPKAEVVPIDPAVPQLTINKSAQVAVLGYHEFVSGKPGNPMQIGIDRFREQMQALRDARIAVIGMPDFLAWRRGEKDIPDPSVVITMDDGWKSVHQLALPVLKEFRYPFTVFLYKRFVNGGGKSMTIAEIRELMAAGGTVGSHSVSHPYKNRIDGMFRKSQEEGDAFLRMEMKDSRQFLEDLIGQPVTTYAYPGGYHSEREEAIGREAGYEAMFTVNPAKVTWDTPASALGRYIVIGTDPTDANFRRAISSRGTSQGELVKQLLGGPDGESLVTTRPEPNATVAQRRPLIEVDVSRLEGIDPASITMKIAGFGPVPADYDAKRGVISHQVQQTMRTSECQVFVTFRRKAEPKTDSVSWRFFIDLVAGYLPEPPEKLAAPVVAAEPPPPPDAAAPAPETPPAAPAPR